MNFIRITLCEFYTYKGQILVFKSMVDNALYAINANHTHGNCFVLRISSDILR